MLDFITESVGSTVSIQPIEAILTIVVTILVGIIISYTYMKTHPKGQHSQSFALTIVLLPAIIAIIIMLIGSDVAKAFSLAGAFSIIRFRSAPGDPKDIAYVLFSMAAGLATGVGEFIYALVFTAVLCLIMYGLYRFKFGQPSICTHELRITIPEDLNYEVAFNDIFATYAHTCTIKQVKTTALGSLYQLVYDIQLHETASIKDFLDALRVRNGNLNITYHIPDGTESSL